MQKKQLSKKRYEALRHLVPSANEIRSTQTNCTRHYKPDKPPKSIMEELEQISLDRERLDKFPKGLMTDQLAEDDALRYYSEILTTYKPLLRQKSFYRLLRVFVQIMYDYSSSAGIYQNVLDRERTPELDLFDFFQKIRTADVKDILHTSRYTARSYAYLVRIIASMLHRKK